MPETIFSEIYDIWVRAEKTMLNPTPLPIVWLPFSSISPEDKIISITIDNKLIIENPQISTILINTKYQQRVIDLTSRYEELQKLFVNFKLSEDRETKINLLPMTSPASAALSFSFSSTYDYFRVSLPTSTFYEAANPRIDQLLEQVIFRGDIEIAIEGLEDLQRQLQQPQQQQQQLQLPRSLSQLIQQYRRLSFTLLAAVPSPSSPPSPLHHTMQLTPTTLTLNIQLSNNQKADILRLINLQNSIIKELDSSIRRITNELSYLRARKSELEEEIRRRNTTIEDITKTIDRINGRLFDYLLTIEEEYPRIAQGIFGPLTRRVSDLQRIYDRVQRRSAERLRELGVTKVGRGKMRLLALLEEMIYFARRRDSLTGLIGGNQRIINERTEELARVNSAIQRREARLMYYQGILNKVRGSDGGGAGAGAGGGGGNILIRITRRIIDAVFRAITKIRRRITFKIFTKKVYYKVEAHVNIEYTEKRTGRTIKNIGYKGSAAGGNGANWEKPQPLDFTSTPSKVHEIRMVIPWLSSLFDEEGRFKEQEKRKKLDPLIVSIISTLIEKYAENEGTEQVYGLLEYFTNYSSWQIGIKDVTRVKSFNTKTYAIFASLDRFGYQETAYLTAELHWGIQKKLGGREEGEREEGEEEGEGEEEEVVLTGSTILPTNWSFADWEEYIEKIKRDEAVT
ncbi:MAG: hypothetical protein QXF17_01375 [Ignisphaera sp.]